MSTSRFGRVRAQLAGWRAERAQFGTRHATVHRIRRLLDLGPVTEGRVELITGQIDQLTGRVGHDEVESTERFDAAARTATETAEALERAVATTAAHRSETELFQRVWTTTAWLESIHVEEDMLVSVALPTRGMRPDGLRRAVDSVVRQAYERWELVVAVDGSEASVAAVESQLPPDERVRVVHSPRQGVSAARNSALAEARGELVAYVDDDNLMAPLWLKAVVWAAARDPDAAIFLGAQLVESGHERGLPDPGPALWAPTFDRRRLRRGNYVDQGAIAHRRNLPEAQYDESLAANVDWDLLLRMTERRDPVMIPVVAGHYAIDVPDRLTNGPDAARSWEIVSARARSLTSLRVLALNAMYPLITETYIGEDLDALATEGAEIACCVMGKRTAPAASPYPLYHDPVLAVAEHEPDVVLIHWAGVGLNSRELLHRLGVPYAVRAHSFPDETELIRQLLEDPQCVGVWCFPHQAFDHPRLHALPTMFTSHERLPRPAAERDLVLSSSAGLPKKDFPLLVEALGLLSGVERRIVVGTTAEHESVITDVVLLTQELDDPPLVQANLTREQVFELLGRTSVLVYTLAPSSGFGCPMSVVEAMTAGACIVLPERPEVREVFGPDVRTYVTARDIARHVETVLAGGADIDAERERLRAWALERFCDAEIGKRFSAELAQAVADQLPGG
jgi:glycosyltransferase involved in cell wall biosynthesis